MDIALRNESAGREDFMEKCVVFLTIKSLSTSIRSTEPALGALL